VRILPAVGRLPATSHARDAYRDAVRAFVAAIQIQASHAHWADLESALQQLLASLPPERVPGRGTPSSAVEAAIIASEVRDRPRVAVSLRQVSRLLPGIRLRTPLV
jgi:hypothetical protein